MSSPRLLIKRPLGSGSFGDVYEVDRNGQSFALKVLKSGGVPCIELKEVKLLVSLRHTNIVKVQTIGSFKKIGATYYELCPKGVGNFGILLELCDTDLRKKLEAQVSGVNHQWSLIIVNQLLDGLIFLHQNGVIHRYEYK